jgi:hypothetical protein
MVERYGVKNPQQNIKIKEKTKKTCFDKYGVNYVFSSENIKNKIKNTCLEKYGTEYPSQNELVVAEFNQRYQRGSKTDVERKRLWWQQQQGEWLIIHEEVLSN